jgi:hypothetical protein
MTSRGSGERWPRVGVHRPVDVFVRAAGWRERAEVEVLPSTALRWYRGSAVPRRTLRRPAWRIVV